MPIVPYEVKNSCGFAQSVAISSPAIKALDTCASPCDRLNSIEARHRRLLARQRAITQAIMTIYSSLAVLEHMTLEMCFYLCYASYALICVCFHEDQRYVENMTVTQQPLLKPEEAAQRLNVPVSTVLAWLRSGWLPGVKIGKEWRVEAADLEQFIQQRKNRPK